MGWGSPARRAEGIAKETKNPTDQLLALLIEEVSALRQELADERKDAEARRDLQSRRSR
jgi:ribosomal protein S15P/S13E